MSKKKHEKTDHTFDDVEPKPLETVKPTIPITLEEVEKPPNDPDVSLGFDDGFNILIAILRNKALEQLNPVGVGKVSRWTIYALLGTLFCVLALVIFS